MSVSDEQAIRQAEAVVDARIGLYKHAVAFAVINAACLAINLYTGTGYLWFLWVALGTGIGLIGHASRVLTAGRQEDMRRRMIDREVQKRADRR